MGLKNGLTRSTLKEPIGLKMMMSTIMVNSVGGKKILFVFIFSTYLLVGL